MSAQLKSHADKVRQRVLHNLTTLRDSVSPKDNWPIQWFRGSPEYQHWISIQDRAALIHISQACTGKTRLISRLLTERLQDGVPLIASTLLVNFADALEIDQAPPHPPVLNDEPAIMQGRSNRFQVYIYQSLLYQLLALRPTKMETMIAFLMKKKAHPETALGEVLTLKLVLDELLPKDKEVLIHIFVDGLEDAKKIDSISVLKTLLTGPLFGCNVKLFLSGRPDSYSISQLPALPMIDQESECRREQAQNLEIRQC
jgi:hypothetical protein